MTQDHHLRGGCGCGCNRRDFLAGSALAAGTLALGPLGVLTGAETSKPSRRKEPARVRAAFVYPPSKTFADNPNGWWSWPGNQFDAEGRQKQYTAALRDMEKRLDVKIDVDKAPVANSNDAKRLAGEVQSQKPDGLLLVLFHNRSLHMVDLILKAAEKVGLPVVFYIGLGVKHGTITRYRRAGVYFIQSLDNLEAIESGLRMIAAKKHLAQSVLLSITEAKEERETTEAFLGIRVRVIPYRRYAEAFRGATIDKAARRWIARFTDGAREVRGLEQKALENAVRAHLGLKALLAEEEADAVTMNCLRRGMGKPCLSFAALNNNLIPATCENDLNAAYTQMLGQRLIGRPGFQHNPAYETEKNHYFGSHCTCATRLEGPEGPDRPFLLRRFLHSNEGSCAIQVFWKGDEPVTMVHYYPGQPPTLDVYAGRVVTSHEMPPVGGCTTNVEIEIIDRADACLVKGHHNLLFCGNFARQFRLFAVLYGMKLADTGYTGPWPACR